MGSSLIGLASARCDEPAAWFQVALDMVADAVFLLSPDSLVVVDANEAACRSLGYSRDELLAMQFEEIAPGAAGAPLAAAIERAICCDGTSQTVHAIHRHRDGFEFPVRLSLRRIDTQSEGHLIIMVAHGARGPVRAAGCMPAGMREPDGLTGLPCRLVLEDRIEWESRQAAKSGAAFAVFFLDVDRFKQINDTRGHLVGDEVLQAVARRLESCLRPTDLAARFGGDEFVAVVAGIRSVADAIQVARRIRRALQRTIEAGGRRMTVSASMGIAMGPDGCPDARGLIDAADQAMYRAKSRGRRGYFTVYRSPETEMPAGDRDRQGGPPAVAYPYSPYSPRLPR